MSKTPAMIEIEMADEAGRDIAEIVVDAINYHGTIMRAAKAFGVTRQTLHSWLRDLNIERDLQYIRRTRAHKK